MMCCLFLVVSTPTLGGKLMCAFDLWVEGACILLYRLAFVVLVREILDWFFGWPLARHSIRIIHEMLEDIMEELER